MKPPQFGYRQNPDPRDFAFPLSQLMGAAVKRPVSKAWKCGATLDQKQTNGCVGFASFQFQVSEPIVKEPILSALQIYAEARKNDEFPGEEDEGTSVRAGLNVLKAHGIITAYHWAQSAEEALEYMLKFGPVIFGTDWTSGMMEPDSHGKIRPTGARLGGHAWFAHAGQWTKKVITGLTSWSENWGKAGNFQISLSDINELFKRGGVAAAVVEA
jgi:hypothetical protein